MDGQVEDVEDVEDGFDGLDDEDFESLPCNLKYAIVCLILPALNGLLNGFLWPAYTLYFQENGWPVVRAGLAQGLGFCFRVLTQQMQLAAGYWLIVPLSVIHLVFAVFFWLICMCGQSKSSTNPSVQEHTTPRPVCNSGYGPQ